MQVTDEMVLAALKQAPKFWRDYNSSADQMRAALEAALAAMWRPISEADRDVQALYGCWLSTGAWYQQILSSPPKASAFTHRADLLPSPPKISARSSAGSEQPPSKRQVAGSNPAERASFSTPKREG